MTTNKDEKTTTPPSPTQKPTLNDELRRRLARQEALGRGDGAAAKALRTALKNSGTLTDGHFIAMLNQRKG
ncbi:MAG: hypothetical protein O3B41_09160 [Bacteroidetes bacterium]|nr:hypothetical protein [Bacteroidota bacterium]